MIPLGAHPTGDHVEANANSVPVVSRGVPLVCRVRKFENAQIQGMRT